MRIQACISGYGGKLATVLATYVDGVVFVAKSVSYRTERVSDSVLVSNTELPAMEFRLTEADLGKAIEAFNQLRNSGLLRIDQAAQACDPSGAIEQDGITETGRKMRISPDIKNGQVAVLAICLYSTRAATNAKVMSMLGELEGIMAGGVMTI